MTAAMVFTNLLYVVGAIVAATVISALILLRHRRPRSLEAGIELFSRELRALAPDAPRTGRVGEENGERPGGPSRGGSQPGRGRGYPPSDGAGASSSDVEQQPG